MVKAPKGGCGSAGGPLLTALEALLREQRARLSNSSAVAKPIDYMLRRWDRFARFVDDGRICLTNNAAERALRGFALGRKSWLFAGSERGADRAAIMATPDHGGKAQQHRSASMAGRRARPHRRHFAGRLNELLPWKWKKRLVQSAA
jgi:transposase